MKDNYCIIMAGGVGSRFWPMSTNQKPKQFLNFLETGRSLIKMTYDRVAHIVPKENIFIVTHEMYKDDVLKHLPDISEKNVLLEPMRRNTAPCIAYASYRILSQNPKANILVLPSDHFIADEKEFISVIEKGIEFISQNDVLLTLGIKPTRPETGYGYIQLAEPSKILGKVKTFTEKPNAEMAQMFISTGEFCWNSGMFLWRADVICKALEKYLPDEAELFASLRDVYATEKEQERINELYPQCSNISIDYAVMEKADNVYVMQADFGWTDVGTWHSLYELMEHDEKGNAVISGQNVVYQANNNIISVPEGSLAVVDGVDDMLIIYQHDVLLVCKKEDQAKMRQFVNDVKIKFDNKFC